MSIQEHTDRIHIRELIDAYAHHADRRETEKQTALFTTDAIIEVYHGEPGTNRPVHVLQGRVALFAGFAGLKQYEITTHINEQINITSSNYDATGETYCMAHQLWTKQGIPTLTVLSIRYYDEFIRRNNEWRFAGRKLIIDWEDNKRGMQHEKLSETT